MCGKLDVLWDLHVELPIVLIGNVMGVYILLYARYFEGDWSSDGIITGSFPLLLDGSFLTAIEGINFGLFIFISDPYMNIPLKSKIPSASVFPS